MDEKFNASEGSKRWDSKAVAKLTRDVTLVYTALTRTGVQGHTSTRKDGGVKKQSAAEPQEEKGEVAGGSGALGKRKGSEPQKGRVRKKKRQ